MKKLQDARSPGFPFSFGVARIFSGFDLVDEACDEGGQGVVGEVVFPGVVVEGFESFAIEMMSPHLDECGFAASPGGVEADDGWFGDAADHFGEVLGEVLAGEGVSLANGLPGSTFMGMCFWRRGCESSGLDSCWVISVLRCFEY